MARAADDGEQESNLYVGLMCHYSSLKFALTCVLYRHGYRIDVQGALDSVSGLEYGRILRQIRGGETVKGHAEQARFI